MATSLHQPKTKVWTQIVIRSPLSEEDTSRAYMTSFTRQYTGIFITGNAIEIDPMRV